MGREPTDATIDAIASECLGVRVRILNRAISSIYDEALRPLGIKFSQMNLLVVAGRLGVARPAEVCRLMQMDVSTLSRNVERMRAKGWLDTVPDADGRAQPFQLTAEGRALIEAAFPHWQRAQQQVEAMVGETGATVLEEAVQRLHEQR